MDDKSHQVDARAAKTQLFGCFFVVSFLPNYFLENNKTCICSVLFFIFGRVLRYLFSTTTTTVRCYLMLSMHLLQSLRSKRRLSSLPWQRMETVDSMQKLLSRAKYSRKCKDVSDCHLRPLPCFLQFSSIVLLKFFFFLHIIFFLFRKKIFVVASRYNWLR